MTRAPAAERSKALESWAARTSEVSPDPDQAGGGCTFVRVPSAPSQRGHGISGGDAAPPPHPNTQPQQFTNRWLYGCTGSLGRQSGAFAKADCWRCYFQMQGVNAIWLCGSSSSFMPTNCFYNHHAADVEDLAAPAWQGMSGQGSTFPVRVPSACTLVPTFRSKGRGKGCPAASTTLESAILSGRSTCPPPPIRRTFSC